MAASNGVRNPRWNREETILAMDLLVRLGGYAPEPEHRDVQALSSLLRSLSFHANTQKQATFRNPAGVALKLKNLNSLRTGAGMTNASKMDREIFAEFNLHPERIATAAFSVRELYVPSNTLLANTEDSLDVFPEGKRATILHIRRERSRFLRAAVLKKYRAIGSLTCQLCEAKAPVENPLIFDSMFEAHHLVPLSQTGETETIVDHMTLLCASCHRIAHRVISLRKKWMTVEELKQVFNGH